MDNKIFALKNLGIITTGYTPSKSKLEYYENGKYPFVKPPQLDLDSYVINTAEYLTKAGFENAKPIEKKTIMVSCIGEIGKVGIAGQRLATNQQINSITFDKKLVYYKYGYYLIKSIKRRLNEAANKSVVPILNKTNFSNIKVLSKIQKQ